MASATNKTPVMTTSISLDNKAPIQSDMVHMLEQWLSTADKSRRSAWLWFAGVVTCRIVMLLIPIWIVVLALDKYPKLPVLENVIAWGVAWSFAFIASFITVVRLTSECQKNYRTCIRLCTALSYKVILLNSFMAYLPNFKEIDSKERGHVHAMVSRLNNTLVSADNLNLNLRRSQVSVKLAEMIIENLADDPSKQMFE